MDIFQHIDTFDLVIYQDNQLNIKYPDGKQQVKLNRFETKYLDKLLESTDLEAANNVKDRFNRKWQQNSTNVTITTTKGGVLKGKLIHVNDSLTYLYPDRPTLHFDSLSFATTILSNDSIKHLVLYRNGRIWQRVGIGFLSGLALGSSFTLSYLDEPWVGLTWLVLNAITVPVGTITGLLIGSSKSTDVTIAVDENTNFSKLGRYAYMKDHPPALIPFFSDPVDFKIQNDDYYYLSIENKQVKAITSKPVDELTFQEKMKKPVTGNVKMFHLKISQGTDGGRAGNSLFPDLKWTNWGNSMSEKHANYFSVTEQNLQTNRPIDVSLDYQLGRFTKIGINYNFMRYFYYSEGISNSARDGWFMNRVGINYAFTPNPKEALDKQFLEVYFIAGIGMAHYYTYEENWALSDGTKLIPDLMPGLELHFYPANVFSVFIKGIGIIQPTVSYQGELSVDRINASSFLFTTGLGFHF